MTSFTHIVSLGYRCRTTRRLRDHFGTSTAFPFDWWITPIEGGARLLRDWDLDRLYDPARLKESRRWGRLQYIVHADYGIRLQHEFPTDAQERVLPGWQAHIAAARARTAHLMQRFDQLDRPDRKVLFVRELQPDEQDRPDRIEALRQAVLERAPRAVSQFLLVSPKGVTAQGWRPLRIDDPVERPWTGTPVIWDAALSGLGFAFERPAHWGDAQDERAGPTAEI